MEVAFRFGGYLKVCYVNVLIVGSRSFSGETLVSGLWVTCDAYVG